MVDKLSVPFLNRLVDAMFDRADPKADQNLWDLARAAEEVCHEVKGEQLTAAYGGPGSTASSELTERQREWIARYGAVGQMQTTGPLGVGWRRTDGGRVQMSPMPLTQAARDYSPPDYAAQLGEVERRLMLKAPQYTGDTATKVDALAQDFQAAAKQIEQQNQGIEKLKHELREKDAAFQDVIGQIRGALDPDGQFEDESLIVLARERMNALAARKQDLVQLQERISTQIEANSAEMLRRVLGAGENETLGQAAKRVADAAPVGWKRYHELEKDARKFEAKIRELVGAQPEVDDWDNPRNEQPTLDAVRRVVRRLVEIDRHTDGSVKARYEVLGDIQGEWDGQEIEPLPGERMGIARKFEFTGPRYVARQEDAEKDYWAVWDKQTKDWFSSIDVGTRNEAERRAAGLNEDLSEESQ